jgi:hypothetical protein
MDGIRTNQPAVRARLAEFVTTLSPEQTSHDLEPPTSLAKDDATARLKRLIYAAALPRAE